MARVLQTYLMVTDVGESVEFYRDGLGLPLTDRSDGRAKFGSDGPALVLEEDFTEEQLAAFGLEPPGDDRGDGAIVVVEVDDVDDVYEWAIDEGAETLVEPMTVDWGRKLFLVADPDGYVVEVSRPTEA